MTARPARILAAGLLALSAVLMAGWYTYEQVGRTPSEIVDYLQRRLQGHPTLEAVMNPLLSAVLQLLDEPDSRLRATPFTVPRMPPNPAIAGGAGPRLASAAPALADPAGLPGAQRIRVGPGQAITSISMAAKLARDGDTIEIEPGDYIADTALWDRDRLTIRGMGPQVRLVAAGAHVEGKAIWVVRRGRVTIEGIDFVGARVPDGNGAGIRFESGHLVIKNCNFHGNQSGILSGNDAGSTLEIEGSEFGYNGAGDGQSHGVYVGRIHRLRVTGSYFHHGNVGQLIKSRAQYSEITYNRITDETGGRSSYELEFPNGGLVRVIGNIVQQGAETENSVMVSYGVEGYTWPQNRLFLVHNTLVNDRPYGGTFVRVSPGAEQVVMRNNLLAGLGKVKGSDVLDAVGDRRVGWPDFELAAREDYRLKAGSRDGLALTPGRLVEPSMVPRYQYAHPRGLTALADTPSHPGAVQTPGR